MPSLLRSFAVFAVVSAVAALSMPGCSQQGEGQRCEADRNGDADCDSGLVCLRQSTLRDGTADRCCRSDGSSTDSRCDLNTGETGAAGKSSGGTGGTSAAAGDSAGGNSAAGTDSVAGGAAGSPMSSEGGTGSSGAPALGDGGVAGATPAAAGAGAGGAP